ETHLDEAEARAAWSHALRNPGAPGRHVHAPRGVVATVAIDEHEGFRYARVTLRREEPPLSHDEAVPLASQIFVLGRFEPFPVDSAIGADGKTLHYALDLERYKEARADDLRRKVRSLLGRAEDGEELDVAAIQLGAPIEQLLGACDPSKAAARDPRTVRF